MNYENPLEVNKEIQEKKEKKVQLKKEKNLLKIL